jgi:hypothetical protein
MPRRTWKGGCDNWPPEGMEMSVAEFLVRIPGKPGRKGEVDMILHVHLLPTNSLVGRMCGS